MVWMKKKHAKLKESSRPNKRSTLTNVCTRIIIQITHGFLL